MMRVFFSKINWFRISLFIGCLFTFEVQSNACSLGSNNECQSAQGLSATYGVQECNTGCNEGASGGPTYIMTHTCSNLPFPTVWYEFQTNATNSMIDLNINSGEIASPVVSIYAGNCNTLGAVVCNQGNNGNVSLSNIRLNASTRYWIAVSSMDGTVGTFDLCTTIKEDESSCNITGAIEVKATSQNSSEFGPFKPGEKVEVCYSIPLFDDVGCNYLHAIIPSFGNGWSPSSFGANGEPLVMTQSLVGQGVVNTLTGPQPACQGDSAGDWGWYDNGIITYNFNSANTLGLVSGDPIGAGWAFLNSYDPSCFDINDPGCCVNPGTNPSDGYGDHDYPGCYQTPGAEWNVCFELTTRSFAECGVNNDCSINFKTFSDGETGAFTNAGCKFDPLTIFSAKLNCGPAPSINVAADATACVGQTVSLPLSSDDPNASFYWINTGDNSSGFSLANPGTFSETFDAVGTYVFEVYATNGCISPPRTLTIRISPEIRLSLSQSPAVACDGQSVTLTPTVSGGSGSFTYLWNDALSSTSPTLTISDFTQTSYTVTVSDGNCQNNTSINLNVGTAPTAIISGNSNICAGESATLNITLTGTGPWNISYTDQLGNNANSIANNANHTINVSPNVTSTYTILNLTDNGPCPGTFSGSATITVDPMVTASFSFDTEFCATASSFTLPTNSDNGLTGTWNPSVFDPSGSGRTATFTPIGDCVDGVTINFTVKPSATPSFSLPSELCKDHGNYTLPTADDNGMPGSWNVASFNTTTAPLTVNLSFTPDDRECNTVFNTSIDIVDSATPTFTLPTELCQNDSPYALPTTSSNGIAGTWAPSVVSTTFTGPVTITFTPNDNCSKPFNGSINITSEQMPVFSFKTSFCESDVPLNFPTMSDNGIAGSWSVVSVNPSSGTQSFTTTFSSTENCTADISIPISVSAAAESNFSLPATLCESDLPYTLPSISNNAISGSWNTPVITTTGITNLTFTPDGDCEKVFNASINVSAFQAPTFSINTQICGSAAPLTLPTNSDNLISGTWSVPVVSGPAPVSSTFTPSGTCASTVTLNFNFDTPTTPSFSLDLFLCETDATITLPTVSQNSITGVWTPSTINPATDGPRITANFVSNENCTDDVNVEFNITTTAQANFSLPTELCASSSLYNLPTISDNGLGGSWNVNPVDISVPNQTIDLIFTPSGNCISPYNWKIDIIEEKIPMFNISTQLCDADAVITLPTISDNGVVGAWTPTTIDPAADGPAINAVFVSTEDCTANANLSFTISSGVMPDFNLPTELCVSDNEYVLPTTSINGIIGVWTPSSIVPSNNSNQSVNLRFESSEACTADVTTSIFIAPEKTPNFSSLDLDHCVLDGVVTLPTISDEGYVGNWSQSTFDPSSGDMSSTFISTEDCVAELVLNFTAINPVNPTFNLPMTLCATDADLVLPSTSTNGIMGTWDISQITTSNGANNYNPIFTPNDVCANTFTTMILVEEEIVPVFNLTKEFCSNEPSVFLPLNSDNGISGSWSVPVIDPSTGVDVSSTFTPDANVCAQAIMVDFTITQRVAPAFSLPTEMCITDNGLNLSSTSDNGIAGSWNVNPIDPASLGSGSVSLTFTPTDDCHEILNTSILISDQLLPDFTVQTDFCATDQSITLPLISNEGVVGSWTISSIDPAGISGSVFSTFNPDPSEACVLPLTLEFKVTNGATPVFNLPVLCDGDLEYTLPIISDNGLSGVWDVPSIDPAGQAGTTINPTFTPNSSCAIAFVGTVNILESKTPVFSFPLTYCSYESAFALPTESDNGISGTWSVSSIDPALSAGNVIQTVFTPDDTDCTASVDVTINVTESPDLGFNDELSYCAGESIDLLALSLTDINTLNPDISFHDGMPTTTANTLASTTFMASSDQVIFIRSEYQGCVVEYPLNITVSQNPQLLTIAPIIACQNEMYPLSLISVQEQNGAIINVSYHSASPADLTNVISESEVLVDQNKTIFVLAKLNDCTTEVPVDFIMTEYPSLSIDASLEICQDDQIEMATIGVNDINATGATITYHTDVNATIANQITDLFFSPNSSTSIFAYAKNGECENVLEIPIQVNPKPALELSGQPVVCVGASLDLNNLNITDLNQTGITWSFHSALPPSAANQLTSTEVAPLTNTSYHAFADAASCSDILSFELNVASSFNAGDDNTSTLCDDIIDFNLNDLLSADAESGVWFDANGLSSFDVTTGIFDASIAGVGNYEFLYIVATDSGACPSDTARFNLEVTTAPYPGDNVSIGLCTASSDAVDLFGLLGTQAQTGGVWTQTLGDVVSLNDPMSVDFTSSSLGIYQFEYALDNDCLNNIATIDIELLSAPDLSIEAINERCSGSSDGEIRIVNNDVTQTIEMSLDNGVTWQALSTLTGLEAKDYEIIFRNQLSCSIEETLTIEAGISLSIGQINIECNDAGTPNLASDDIYDVMALVMGPSGTQFELLDNNNVVGIFDYNQVIMIELPADGQAHELFINDLNDLTCSINYDLGMLPDCSVTCSITNAIISEVVCQDNDTPALIADDVFYATINVTAQNNSSQWTLVSDPSIVGAYDMDVTVGPFLISDGDVNIQIVDINFNDCSYDLTLLAPSACSSSCALELLNLQVSDCENNNTPDNNNDDLFSIDFTIVNDNGGSYIANIDAAQYGPFNYNEIVSIDQLSANGQMMTIVIVDELDQACTTNFEVMQNACSTCTESAGFVDTDRIILDCENTMQSTEISLSSTGTYVWTGPDSGDFFSDVLNATFDQQGVYNLEITHSNGCISTLQLTVENSAEKPSLTTGEDQEITCLIDEAQLSANSNSTNVTYAWYDASGNLISDMQNTVVTTAGVYSVIATDVDTKCDSDELFVTVTENKIKPDMGILSNPGTTINCAIDSIEIAPDGDLTGYEVKWIIDGIEIQGDKVSIYEATSVILEITDESNGCTQSSTIIIDEDFTAPDVNLNVDGILDCENQEVTIGSDGSSDTNDTDYQWYNGQLEPMVQENYRELVVVDPGVYYLEIINVINGCSTMDSVTVEQDVDTPEVQLGDDVFIPCGDDELIIQAQMMSSLNQYVIEWYDADLNMLQTGVNESININEIGKYFVKLTNLENACFTFDSINVTADPSQIQDVEIEIDNPTCFGESDGGVSIIAVESAGTNFTYLLNGIEVDVTDISGLDAGLYDLEIVNAEGCNYSMNFTVEEGNDLSLSIELDDINQVKLGDSIQLITQINLDDSEIAMIDWTNSNTLSCIDCLNPFAFPLNNTNYELMITDENGCVITRDISILVSDEVDFYLPNVFSPNGDGTNDIFVGYGDLQVERIVKFEVFNRWGNKVFDKEDIEPGDESNGWDGNYNGGALMGGVYVYKLEVVLKNGKIKQYKGDITLIR